MNNQVNWTADALRAQAAVLEDWLKTHESSRFYKTAKQALKNIKAQLEKTDASEKAKLKVLVPMMSDHRILTATITYPEAYMIIASIQWSVRQTDGTIKTKEMLHGIANRLLAEIALKYPEAAALMEEGWDAAADVTNWAIRCPRCKSDMIAPGTVLTHQCARCGVHFGEWLETPDLNDWRVLLAIVNQNQDHVDFAFTMTIDPAPEGWVLSTFIGLEDHKPLGVWLPEDQADTDVSEVLAGWMMQHSERVYDTLKGKSNLAWLPIEEILKTARKIAEDMPDDDDDENPYSTFDAIIAEQLGIDLDDDDDDEPEDEETE